MLSPTMTVPAVQSSLGREAFDPSNFEHAPSSTVHSEKRQHSRRRPRSGESNPNNPTGVARKNSFMEVSEAFYTGVGVLIGMALFATSQSDFVFGGGLFVLLLMSLSTPEVLDMEMQYTAYKAQHTSSLNHLLYALCVWPRFLTCLIMVSAESSWASLMTTYYAMYFLISDRSITGIVAALLVLGSAGCANAVVHHFGEEAFIPAVVAHCFFWHVQLMSHLLLENPKQMLSSVSRGSGNAAKSIVVSLAVQVRDNFLQFVLMSPLLVTIECAVQCGFRQEFARRANVAVSNMRTEKRLRSDSESSS